MTSQLDTAVVPYFQSAQTVFSHVEDRVHAFVAADGNVLQTMIEEHPDHTLRIFHVNLAQIDGRDPSAVEAIVDLNGRAPGKFIIDSEDRVSYVMDVPFPWALSPEQFGVILGLTIGVVSQLHTPLMRICWAHRSCDEALQPSPTPTTAAVLAVSADGMAPRPLGFHVPAAKTSAHRQPATTASAR